MKRFVLTIGAGGILLACTTLYYYDKWRQERLAHLETEIGFSLFLLDLLHPRVRTTPYSKTMTPLQLQTAVSQSKINWTAHELLDPAPQSVKINGPLTIDVIFDQVNCHAHLFSDLSVSDFSQLASTIRQISNPHIWNRLLIHNTKSGILEIQANTGKDTICVQI